MSHTTTLKGVVIRDVSALRQAVSELQGEGVKCSLLMNAKPRMYYSNQHGNCDFVVRLDESKYDVGLDRQEDGSYIPVFDEFMNSVGAQIGATCPMPDTSEGRAQHQIGRLMQKYATYAAINAASAQGYMVEETSMDADGNVHLTIGGM